jgi:hypothetical protein
MRPPIDLAPRPDVPDIPFAFPAVPSVPKASVAVEAKPAEAPMARPVARPEMDVAPKPDSPDVAFEPPAAREVTPTPKPVARPRSHASVAVDAKPEEARPASPTVPQRPDVDKAPRPDVPDIAFAPPLPGSAGEPGRQASPDPTEREPSSVPTFVPPAKIASGTAEAPTVETKARALPMPPRKLPHVARHVEEPVLTQPDAEPQQQASVQPDTMPAEALIEPVKPQERKARPEIDMAPRPDTPDTVFIVPEIVARNSAALDSIVRHTGSVTRNPKPEADIARSGSPAAGREALRQDEAALGLPPGSPKSGPGAEAHASATVSPPATPEESACEKAKKALASDAFTDLEAKSCKGIVFSFIGTQQGKTYSIKFGPLTGEYIAIQQASSTSTGLSLDVLRGKVDDAKTE